MFQACDNFITALGSDIFMNVQCKKLFLQMALLRLRSLLHVRIVRQLSPKKKYVTYQGSGKFYGKYALD